MSRPPGASAGASAAPRGLPVDWRALSRVKDIPHVLRAVGPWTFAKRIYTQTIEDNLLVWAAALAYSWLFALFPFLIFCLSLLPLLPDQIGSGENAIKLKPSAAQIRHSIDAALVTGENRRKPAAEVTIPMAPTTAATRGGMRDGTRDGTRGGSEKPPADVDPERPGTQPAPITMAVSGVIESVLNKPSGGKLLTFSIVIALFTASGGMAMTMAGLDKCYDVQPNKIRPVYYSRPIAMLLTVVMAVLVLLAVILIPVTGAILSRIGHTIVFGVELVPFLWAIDLVRYTLAILLLLGVLAMIYRWGPSLHTRMHLFSPGSIFCVLMWLLMGQLFNVYLNNLGAAANYAKTYGAVAGVAVLMLLFYLDGLFLLLGAEINSEIDFIKLGIRSGRLPAEQEVAPIPTYKLDDEDRALKAELEERRSIDVTDEAADEVEGPGAGI